MFFNRPNSRASVFFVGDYICDLDIPSVIGLDADKIYLPGAQLTDGHFISKIDKMQVHGVFYYFLNVGIPFASCDDVP